MILKNVCAKLIRKFLGVLYTLSRRRSAVCQECGRVLFSYREVRWSLHRECLEELYEREQDILSKKGSSICMGLSDRTGVMFSLGVACDFLRDVERGNRHFNMERAGEIRRALGVVLSQLKDEEEGDHEKEALSPVKRVLET